MPFILGEKSDPNMSPKKRRIRCQICNRLFKWQKRRIQPLRKHSCSACHNEMKLLDILIEFEVSDKTMHDFGFERVDDGQTD